METNYSGVAEHGSPEALGGAVHHFLMEFDALLARNGQVARLIKSTPAGIRYDAMRSQLACYGYVCQLGSTRAPLLTRWRAAWRVLRAGVR